ncbi:MAG: hypothetical protein WCW17_01290 [Patescibacteria group bacterium]|jgi:hypothetical protein
MKLSKPIKILLTVLPLMIAALVMFTPVGSLAAISEPYKDTTKLNNVENIISFILKVVITIAAVVVFVLFAVAGITYVTGAGNEEQTGKAKKMMIDAAIGLAITVAAYALGKYVIVLIVGKDATSSISSVTF